MSGNVSSADENWDWMYDEGAALYNQYSSYQDSNNKAFNRLLSHADFRNKIILEVGCGSGKYTPLLAQLAKKYYALDRSESLLHILQQKCKDIHSIQFLQADAAHIPLPDNCIDCVFSSWGFPTYDAPDASAQEAARVLKDTGDIWLISNYPTGEFMTMRGEEEIFAKKDRLTWYIDNGFELIEIVDSHFAFPSMEVAKELMTHIFREKAINYLTQHPTAHMQHSIAIWHKKRHSF